MWLIIYTYFGDRLIRTPEEAVNNNWYIINFSKFRSFLERDKESKRLDTCDFKEIHILILVNFIFFPGT